MSWVIAARTCSSSSLTPASPLPDTAWYELTIRRRSPASACKGCNTGIAAIVVQLGLAIIPLRASPIACGLTSLTTRGTSGSIRQADELSITMTPAAAYFGASTLDDAPPAENSAMSMPVRSAVSASSTRISVPRHGNVVPADRSDAKNRTCCIGKSRSSSSRRMTVPTWPVAPTTATTGLRLIFRTLRKQQPHHRHLSQMRYAVPVPHAWRHPHGSRLRF